MTCLEYITLARTHDVECHPSLLCSQCEVNRTCLGQVITIYLKKQQQQWSNIKI